MIKLNYQPNGTVPGMVLVYEHPQGGVIEVFPDGTFTARDWRGKKKKTSATPEKLMNGHGKWVLTHRYAHKTNLDDFNEGAYR